jgi:hypothetical protein
MANSRLRKFRGAVASVEDLLRAIFPAIQCSTFEAVTHGIIFFFLAISESDICCVNTDTHLIKWLCCSTLTIAVVLKFSTGACQVAPTRRDFQPRTF